MSEPTIDISLGGVDEGIVFLEGVPEYEAVLASLHLGRPLETKHYRTDGFHFWWDHYLTWSWDYELEALTGKVLKQKQVIQPAVHPHKEADVLIGFKCNGCYMQDYVVLINTWVWSHYLEPRGWDAQKNFNREESLSNYPTIMGDLIKIVYPAGIARGTGYGSSEEELEATASSHILECPQEGVFGPDYWMKKWKEMQDGFRRAIPSYDH